MDPLVGFSSVVSILMVVVLPAPLGPRKAKISPSSTSNETSLTAVKEPNVFTRFRTRIIQARPPYLGLPLQCELHAAKNSFRLAFPDRRRYCSRTEPSRVARGGA